MEEIHRLESELAGAGPESLFCFLANFTRPRRPVAICKESIHLSLDCLSAVALALSWRHSKVPSRGLSRARVALELPSQLAADCPRPSLNWPGRKSETRLSQLLRDTRDCWRRSRPGHWLQSVPAEPEPERTRLIVPKLTMPLMSSRLRNQHAANTSCAWQISHLSAKMSMFESGGQTPFGCLKWHRFAASNPARPTCCPNSNSGQTRPSLRSSVQSGRRWPSPQLFLKQALNERTRRGRAESAGR